MINDKGIVPARSALRTQIPFHLEKQSGFLDTEVFRSREKKDSLWETKDVLESTATELSVTFSTVQLQAMAVLKRLSAGSLLPQHD